jgi:peroxiredoxin
MKNFLLFLTMIFLSLGSLFAQQVGAPAPDFTHTTLSHGPITLSDYKGKVVYLFFFGWD